MFSLSKGAAWSKHGLQRRPLRFYAEQKDRSPSAQKNFACANSIAGPRAQWGIRELPARIRNRMALTPQSANDALTAQLPRRHKTKSLVLVSGRQVRIESEFDTTFKLSGMPQRLMANRRSPVNGLLTIAA